MHCPGHDGPRNLRHDGRWYLSSPVQVLPMASSYTIWSLQTIFLIVTCDSNADEQALPVEPFYYRFVGDGRGRTHSRVRAGTSAPGAVLLSGSDACCFLGGGETSSKATRLVARHSRGNMYATALCQRWQVRPSQGRVFRHGPAETDRMN